MVGVKRGNQQDPLVEEIWLAGIQSLRVCWEGVK